VLIGRDREKLVTRPRDEGLRVNASRGGGLGDPVIQEYDCVMPSFEGRRRGRLLALPRPTCPPPCWAGPRVEGGVPVAGPRTTQDVCYYGAPNGTKKGLSRFLFHLFLGTPPF